MQNTMWYDVNRILSYKALINVVIGIRGGGKTYGTKKRFIIDFKEKGWQFVWLRRYGTELDETLKTFFNAIRRDEDLRLKYGDLQYYTIGNKIYIDDELAGYFVALTTASRYKSSDFPDVRNLAFDEFIPDEGSRLSYLKNEVTMLYNLIETIQRQRDNMRVIMIANAISFATPYFIAWKVKPFKQEFLYLSKLSVVIQMYYNQDFKELKETTRFGKLTAGTEYAEYAINNKFSDVSDVFIEKKSNKSVYRCTVKYEGAEFGFWLDYELGLLFATTLIDKNAPHQYTLSQKDHDINYYLISNVKGTYMSEIIEAYKLGILRFESVMTKAQVIEILTLFIK